MKPQAAAEIAKVLCATAFRSFTRTSRRFANLLLMPVSEKENEGEEQPYDRKLLTAACAQLRPQDLAEVLKYPFCTGGSRADCPPPIGGKDWPEV
jgi:hypothetical protein